VYILSGFKSRWDWEYSLVVECLPGRQEALDSVLSIKKQNKKNVIIRDSNLEISSLKVLFKVIFIKEIMYIVDKKMRKEV
jgi:hypothetical protein